MATYREKADTSGFFDEPKTDSSGSFTDFEEIASSRYTTLVKARKNGKWFVLKALAADCRGKGQYEMLLRKEYAIGAKFDHPNIVHYIDLVDVKPLGRCIQMDYIVGLSLAGFLAEPRSAGEKKRIVWQLCAGLKAIHAEQVVHRDLKPSNILITENGHNVKIIDFGFSDADSYSILKEPAGTEGYSSPEQVEGELPPDNRADIYSLGVIMREIRLPVYYNKVVGKCLREDRERRYATVEEFEMAFRRQGKAVAIAGCLVAAAVAVAFVMVFQNTAPGAETKSPAATAAVSARKDKPGKEETAKAAAVTPGKTVSKQEGSAAKEEDAKQVQSAKAPAKPSAKPSSKSALSFNALVNLLHKGLDDIIDPYIEKRKEGMNMAEYQTSIHKMDRQIAGFKSSFFSRDDLGESAAVLLHEYEWYIKAKATEYANAGKVRQLTAKERAEIIRRQMPQLRKKYGDQYGKPRQDTTEVRP